MRRRIAVVFSGCGFLDGSEITESVSTLIALDKYKADYHCFAPNQDLQTINHLAGEADGSKRNILAEAARIARGKIQDLEDLDESKFDGIIFPGGYGAAKNLCDFAVKGSQATIHNKVKQLIIDFHNASKPIGAFCIAPAVVALGLKDSGIHITIGNDEATAGELEKLGVQHINCGVSDFVTDRENKIITTPAYMYEANPFEVFTGIEKAVQEIVEMA